MAARGGRRRARRARRSGRECMVAGLGDQVVHGGFYKQFSSKDDLIAQACDQALARGADKWTRVVDSGAPDVLADLVGMYLSRSHRDRRADGCALATLGGDVVRA